MKNLTALISTPTAFIISFALAASGHAQQMAPGGPSPGTVDAAKASNSYRESNSDYNRIVGSGVPVATKERTAKVHVKATPASVADIKVGSALRDSQGTAIGTIDSINDQGVVVNTGTTKIRVPVVAFGKDDKGLLLGITAARFNELIVKAQGAH